ncbi:MAG: cyanophycin synthetase [Acidobacteriota bacterium]
MKIIQFRFLRGPNLYAWRPCLLATIDPGSPEDTPLMITPDLLARMSEQWPELNEEADPLMGESALSLLPAMVDLLQDQGERESPVSLHIRAQRPDQPHRIVCDYQIEAVAEYALHQAVALLNALVQGETFNLAAVQQQIGRLSVRHGLGPSTQAIVEAARRRDIPVIRLTEQASLFQLGWGRGHHRIQATMTDGTSHIAVATAGNKQRTKELLDAAGIPVPRGEVVRSLDEALAAVDALGRPVTIKPLGGNQGKGVTVGPSTREEVERAYERAASHDRQVLVERAIAGVDHRALVVGQRLVAVARRTPPSVLGDGLRSVRALLDAENADPRRGEGHERSLTRIPLDAELQEVLALQGLDLDAVPASGRCVLLRRNANLSTGGSAEDVTDLIHPDTAARCIQAACQIGLDIAGIDLVCEDIGLPLEEQGGAIIEVNAAPGIRMHEAPSLGPSRPAGQAIVDMLFGTKPTHNGRIPLIAVTGTNGKTTTTLAIAHALAHRGLCTGWSTSEGVFINGRQIMSGDCSGYWSARAILSDQSVEYAVVETARGGILKRGLAFDRCDVAVVLNISADHLGLDGIETLDDLAQVKGVVANAASRAVVLNADDPLCVAMAPTLRHHPEVIYFGRDLASPVVREHIDAGGRAVIYHQQALTVVTRAHTWRLVDARELPCTMLGMAEHNIDNMLAAAAALIAVDSPAAAIGMGLRQFHSNVSMNPLRMNFFQLGSVTVVVDYAHNVASYRALTRTLRQVFPHQRLIGVVSVPGDRRIDDIKDVARMCAQSFDELIVYELDDLRDREPAEMARAFLQGAWSAGTFTPASDVLDIRDALLHAVHKAGPRDVVVLGCACHLEDVFEVANRLGVEAREWGGMESGRFPGSMARFA